MQRTGIVGGLRWIAAVVGLGVLAGACGGADRPPEPGERAAQASGPAPAPKADSHSSGTRTGAPAPDPCVPGVLTGDGVGGLRVGRPVAELRRDCRILLDTVDPNGPEGRPQRMIRVAVGRDGVTAEIEGESVRRLRVETPRLRTEDSLGVGSTLRNLLQLPDVVPYYGEGLFVLSRSRCGLSFELGRSVFIPPQLIGRRAALEMLPDTTRVWRVLVTGCR